jgi:hypothetical protein
MKRSRQISAPLLAAAALGVMAGCRQPEMQRCVDEQNHVVPDNLCQGPNAVQQRPVGPGGALVPMLMYRYYYGGGGGWGLGSTVTGGGYMPSPGRSYATSTMRGGFGRSFGGHGGGGGE